jgi:hypothetical protein
MLTMRHHNSQDYAVLPDIDKTNAGTITADDKACLDEIGSNLLRARAHARFGATLLHSHFPIDSGETLLEEVQADAKLITLRPVRTNRSSLFATNVRFDGVDPRTGEIRLVGLEFSCGQTLAGVAPINERDGDVLALICGILHRRRKTNRFGIRLLHDPLRLDGDVLLETCDPMGRILTCRGARQDDSSFAQSIATVFRWEEVRAIGEDGLIGAQECIQLCKSVQRCTRSAHGDHKQSSDHQPSGHRSF